MAKGGGKSGCRGQTNVLEAVAAQPVAFNQAAGPEATRQDLVEVMYARTPMRIEELEDFEKLNGSAYATRRALEAVLAAAHGMSEEEFKLENAHRSWRELYDHARQLSGDMDLDLTDLAKRIEHEHRWSMRKRGGIPEGVAPRMGPDMEELAEKYEGTGAASGRLEDYSRKELCKLLGYLQRDAKDFSDDDLRAMALDAHLLPRWKGAPSHVELAQREGDRWQLGKTRRSKFLKAMRTPYGKLAAANNYRDDGMLSREALLEAMRDSHPFLTLGNANTLAYGKVAKLAQACGIEMRHSESARYQAANASTTSYVSSADKRFGEVFRAWGNQFNGAKLSKVVGHGASNSWGQAVGKSRGAYAVYVPSTGEVHLSPKLDRLVGKAQQGKASPEEVFSAAKSTAHELFHAASNGNGDAGYRSAKNREHTVEEGFTEALARLHADKLARQMGLWDKPESLRQTAGIQNGGAYNPEVESMIALAAACNKELDSERLQAGEYAQPEALSARAVDWMTRLHTRVPRAERAAVMAQDLASATGCSPETAKKTVSDVLAQSKRREYGWTKRRKVEYHQGSKYVSYDYVKPPPFTPDLAQCFAPVL